ncbi:hypothetical protein [Fusobacterium sp. PH5-44]|uniref:hypothetical protein n=1 Tax=unclassified Fusobacterium TaxID=2648384 RepID=UPI003D1FB801
MNILSLCGNYNSLKDGIGRYGKIFNDVLAKDENSVDRVFVATGYTDELTKKQLLFSLEMSKAIKKAIAIIKMEKIDILIIEYPFMEHNPLILFFFLYLKLICNKKKIMIILSLHEYLRAKKLRKILIKILIKISDKVIVSDEETKSSLLKYSKNIFIRDIPCMIELPKEYNKVSNGEFVYFGLVNNSKAFYPMINAWKKFNIGMKYVLNVITSSDINISDNNRYGINILQNLDEIQIAEYMKSANYCILPILPEVNYNNSTFKTASMFGCISVGKFADDFKNLKFIVDIPSYEEEELIKGLNRVIQFNENEKMLKFDLSKNFGKKFTMKNAVIQTIKIIIGFV